ncbi:MAG: DoxX family protein [Pseudomonadota bacterium]
MILIDRVSQLYSSALQQAQRADFLAPVALRLFLAPIFILAGWNKLTGLEGTAYYFGEMLGMPAPMFMAVMAGSTELIGGISLLIGLGMRLMTLPLMMTMLVAAVTAHWENGWHVLPESTLTMPWEWRPDLIEQANEKKEMAKSILREHGNYSWLTEAGAITVLKNGVEFAATYFAMLLALFFMGPGRYISLDYWLKRSLDKD